MSHGGAEDRLAHCSETPQTQRLTGKTMDRIYDSQCEEVK
jgi:hypothetical protein